MNEQQCIDRMVAPGQERKGRWLGGILQIHVTRSCDRSCFGCTQLSQMRGPYPEMTPEQFEVACQSLRGYPRVVGLFGGNPALAKHFGDYCRILRRYFSQRQLGIWTNNPITVEKAQLMRRTFNPSYSNLNVHMDRKAWDLFKTHWPKSKPKGLHEDSRHSPPFVAMSDMDELPFPDGPRPNTEENRWELISRCDINQSWSAIIGLVRGQVKAFFCEIAYTQSVAHQNDKRHDPSNVKCPYFGIPLTEGDTTFREEFTTASGVTTLGSETEIDWNRCTCYSYPDTGITLPLPPTSTPWWTWPMSYFSEQVRKHCHECGVPLQGYGALACASDDDAVEQVSETHRSVFHPKRQSRRVEVVTKLEQIGVGRLQRMTEYIENSHR